MKVKGIPNSFQLFGHTITVEYSSNLVPLGDALGMSLLKENRILLAMPTKDIARSVLVQTFYHELTHFIFFYLSEEEHCLDEMLVDRVGQLLHQFIVSQK
jgi:hypothetical protein